MLTTRPWRLTGALLAAGLLAACGQADPPVKSTTPNAQPGLSAPGRSVPTAGRMFAPNSVWNAPLANNAAIDPSSPRLIKWLDDQVTEEFAKGPTPNVETVSDSTPIYRVPRNQPTVRVTLDSSLPYGKSLAEAFRSVPIPRGAVPAAGSDGHLTVWQPSTNRMWELWEARHTSTGWHAAWGGAMDNVSQSPGYYTARSWPGARSYWGSTATSLPVAGGTILTAELEAGRIDHALAIALPAARAGVYASPAERTDGTDPDPNSIPEGAHLRLDPRLNVAALGLPPVLKAIALAAQRYGLIVRDKTGEAFAFYAQAPTGRGTDPYDRLFKIPPYDFLKHFPWSHLEVLRMDLHRGTGSP